MYSPFKELSLRLLKAPRHPPDPPAGSHDSLQVFRASPRYLIYRLLGFSILASILTLTVLFLYGVALVQQELAPLVVAVILTPMLATAVFIGYFLVRIDYDMRYYIVTDRSLRIREGAFIVKEKTITFANVQNLRVVQGPVMRLFRIWNLNVDTAGGGASRNEHTEKVPHRVKMAGIENAHEVRDLIRGHLKDFAVGTGLGDLDDHDDDSAARVGSSPEFVDALRALRDATSDLRTAVVDRPGRG